MWRKQGMDYYDIIFNELQNRVNREELTLEMAEEINDLAQLVVQELEQLLNSRDSATLI